MLCCCGVMCGADTDDLAFLAVWKRVMGRKQQALQDLDSLKSSSKKAERHLKVASECQQLCRGGGVAALATCRCRSGRTSGFARVMHRICTCLAATNDATQLVHVCPLQLFRGRQSSPTIGAPAQYGSICCGVLQMTALQSWPTRWSRRKLRGDWLSSTYRNCSSNTANYRTTLASCSRSITSRTRCLTSRRRF